MDRRLIEKGQRSAFYNIVEAQDQCLEFQVNNLTYIDDLEYLEESYISESELNVQNYNRKNSLDFDDDIEEVTEESSEQSIQKSFDADKNGRNEPLTLGNFGDPSKGEFLKDKITINVLNAKDEISSRNRKPSIEKHLDFDIEVTNTDDQSEMLWMEAQNQLDHAKRTTAQDLDFLQFNQNLQDDWFYEKNQQKIQKNIKKQRQTIKNKTRKFSVKPTNLQKPHGSSLKLIVPKNLQVNDPKNQRLTQNFKKKSIIQPSAKNISGYQNDSRLSILENMLKSPERRQSTQNQYKYKQSLIPASKEKNLIKRISFIQYKEQKENYLVQTISQNKQPKTSLVLQTNLKSFTSNRSDSQIESLTNIDFNDLQVENKAKKSYTNQHICPISQIAKISIPMVSGLAEDTQRNSNFFQILNFDEQFDYQYFFRYSNLDCVLKKLEKFQKTRILNSSQQKTPIQKNQKKIKSQKNLQFQSNQSSIHKQTSIKQQEQIIDLPTNIVQIVTHFGEQKKSKDSDM